MKILIAGQSNAARLKGNNQAIAELTNTFDEIGNPCEVSFSAVGGSALLHFNASTSTPDNYWLIKTSTGGVVDGNLLSSAKAQMEVNKPDVIIWIQGEQDATRIINAEGKAEYKDGLKYLFDQFLGYCDLVVVATIGRRLENKDKGFHLVRMASIDTAKEMRNVEVMAHSYMRELEDVVHYSSTGQVNLCHDLAENIQNYLSSAPTITLGAKAIDAKGYSRAMDVTFDDDIGSYIDENSHILFSLRDINGNLIQNPYSINRLSSIKVRLFFNEFPELEYLCIGVGQLTGIDSDLSKSIICANGKHIQPSMIKVF
jgi:hypothetical protein